jgi:DNA polymerase (family 10)
MAHQFNSDIAKILAETGEFLAMQNIPFKPRAYQKAAQTIDALEESVAEQYEKGGRKALENIPGVGKGISEKIEEFIKTGKVKELANFQKKTPINLAELSKVEGLGPKSVKTLYEKLGVKNLKELEAAAKAGKIAKLEGFGKKSEDKILANIGFAKTSGKRFPIWIIIPEVRSLEAQLNAIPDVLKVTVAGSVRRRKETIGDIDILATSKKPKEVMEKFIHFPGVVHVIAHGETKSSVKLRSGANVDLRIVPSDSYGAALNYFTGSKEHNVAIREIAIRKGLKLNEYGLFKATEQKGKDISKEKLVAGKTEEEIYAKLGMDYIEPELRERTGEIDAAMHHKLPKIIGYNDLRGDLQIQTNWTDGSDSIETMARAAIKHGLEYIVITDHTKRLAMAHGLDDQRIKEQWKEIDRVQKKFGKSFRILKGTECDILKNGTLDLKNETLAKLDVVGVSVHSYFNLPRKEQTERIIRAMENPNVDILFHPTGRIVGRRPPYDVDMEAIIACAKRTKTILEIDALERLDLKDEYIRMCVDAGVKMAIDSDAHTPNHYEFLEYGIAQARRGWATKDDIINAWPLQKMLRFLK